MNKVIKVTEDTIYVGKNDGEIVKTNISNASWDVKVGDEVEIFANDEIIILYLIKKLDKELEIENKQKLRQEIENDIKQKLKVEYKQKLRQEVEYEIRQEIEAEVREELKQKINAELRQEMYQQNQNDLKLDMLQEKVQNLKQDYKSRQENVNSSFKSRIVKKCKPKLIVKLTVFFAVFLAALITISVLPHGIKYTGEYELYDRTIKISYKFSDGLVEIATKCDELPDDTESNKNETNDENIEDELYNELLGGQDYKDGIIKEMLGTELVKYKIKDGYLYLYNSLTGYIKQGTISSTKIEIKGSNEAENIVLKDNTLSTIKTVSIVCLILFGTLDLIAMIILYLKQNGIIKTYEEDL
ncbi:MAG: hypothetical protein IJX17_08015 [Clostridia bacterium]|nr:hypothetical protein [Clostridia bacterium]